MEAFNTTAEQVLDIFCHDPVVRKHLELKHGVKMSDMEWTFLKDQRTRRKMYCEDFLDRKWMKTMERRRRDLQYLEKKRDDAEKERELSKLVASFEDNEQSEDGDQYTDTDQTFSESSGDEGDVPTYSRVETQGKKWHLSSLATLTQTGGELLSKCKHVHEHVRIRKV